MLLFKDGISVTTYLKSSVKCTSGNAANVELDMFVCIAQHACASLLDGMSYAQLGEIKTYEFVNNSYMFT